jgi:heme/copper-type cytochrome/quinol oxidase subunit 2
MKHHGLSVKKNGVVSPVRFIKFPVINTMNFDEFYKNNTTNFFRLRFAENTTNIEQKNPTHYNYLTVKQKRYKRKTTINIPLIYYKKDEFSSKIRYPGKLSLRNNSIFVDNSIDPTQYYRMLKKNKNRFELISGVYSKRMLRTQRTLVLPAHVNITAITNSYDVIHS